MKIRRILHHSPVAVALILAQTVISLNAGISEAGYQAPATSSVILDGASIVQMLKPTVAKNFVEYASQIFIPYVLSQFQNRSRVDLLWDMYVEDSLKGTARPKCGQGVKR